MQNHNFSIIRFEHDSKGQSKASKTSFDDCQDIEFLNPMRTAKVLNPLSEEEGCTPSRGQLVIVVFVSIIAHKKETEVSNLLNIFNKCQMTAVAKQISETSSTTRLYRVFL